MSNLTTNFGPRVSFTTSKSDGGPIHVHIPSTGTLTGAGTNTFTGAATFSGAFTVPEVTFSTITTASPTSVFVGDGVFSVVSHSANSIVFAIRSGVTTYSFTNDAGAVL